MQLSAPSDCILLFYAIINRMICAYQIRFLFTSSTYSADLLYSSVNLRSPASGGAKDVEHECEHPRYVNVLSNMLIKRGGRTQTRSTLKSHCFFTGFLPDALQCLHQTIQCAPRCTIASGANTTGGAKKNYRTPNDM
jgi:hypothetical protein